MVQQLLRKPGALNGFRKGCYSALSLLRADSKVLRNAPLFLLQNVGGQAKMRDWKQIEDIWIDFCQKSNLTLEKRERHYISGKTQYYSTKELHPDFTIAYNHRYEKPDLGVQPEELKIAFKAKGFRFKRIDIKKRGFVNRLFNDNPIKIKSSFKVSVELKDIMIGLVNAYPTAKLKTANNEVNLILNEFPKSTADLEMLRNTLKRLSIGLMKGPAT